MSVTDIKARSFSVDPGAATTKSVDAHSHDAGAHTHTHTHDWGGTGAEHSVQRRVCKACWAQPGHGGHGGGAAGTEGSLRSAALQLAKQYESQVRCVVGLEVHFAGHMPPVR
jgi:hypothetical protein